MPTNLRSARSGRRDLLLLQDEWPSTLFYTEIVCRQIYVQLTCRIGQVHRLNWIKDMHSGARQQTKIEIYNKTDDFTVLLAVNLSALSPARSNVPVWGLNSGLSLAAVLPAHLKTLRHRNQSLGVAHIYLHSQRK